MSPPVPGVRLPGVDLARFVALTGMVLVHAWSDLAPEPPPTAAGGAGLLLSPLELLQGAVTDRARLLFLLLAGVGASLHALRRGVRTSLLLRRAAFLLVLGVVLSLTGWGDLVLLFYAVLFALAPVLLRLPSPVLLTVAVLFLVPGAVSTSLDPGRVQDATGVLLIVGEALPVFCLGVVVGRLGLTDGKVLGRLAAAGASLSVPGLLVLGVRGGPAATSVAGGGGLIAATTSTAGLCLLVVSGCLALCHRGAGRGVRTLATTGATPLTVYVGHALLLPRVAGVVVVDLVQATGFALGYLAVAVGFAVWWRRRHRTGPVEAVLRRVGGS